MKTKGTSRPAEFGCRRRRRREACHDEEGPHDDDESRRPPLLPRRLLLLRQRGVRFIFAAAVLSCCQVIPILWGVSTGWTWWGASASSLPTRVTGYGSRSYRRQYQQEGRDKAPRQRPVLQSSSATAEARDNGIDAVKEEEDEAADSGRAQRLRVRLWSVGEEDSRTKVLEVRRESSTLDTMIRRSDGTVLNGEEGFLAVASCDGAIVSVLGDGTLQIRAAPQASKNDTEHSTERVEDEMDVEGLFGVYRVPSGRLWVWIADSEPVYRAPSIRGNTRWFEIRRVRELHIQHLPHSSFGVIPSALQPSLRRAQRLEETRQLSLLRQALKHHDWYFCGGSEPRPTRRHDNVTRPKGEDDTTMVVVSACVPDMTVNLQAALLDRVVAANDDSGGSVIDQSAPHPWWWWWWRRRRTGHSRNLPTTSPRSPVSRFFWNEALLEELLSMQEEEATTDSEAQQASEFLLSHAIPVTSAFCGFQRNVSIHNTNMHSTTGTATTQYYDHVLITRRSRFRAGTRFTKRGADHTGAVANYAETEQIIFIHDGSNNSNNALRTICSHVQTRGSIPLRWSSPTDIKTYRPRVRIGTDPIAQARAVRHHVVDQMTSYVLPKRTEGRFGHASRRIQHPELVFVNLVDKKSDQGRLGKAFDAVLRSVIDVYASQDNAGITNQNASLLGDSSNASHGELALPLNFSNVQHIWYDFHAEVKHGRWGRLSQLLAEVKGSLREQGYFRATALGVHNRSVVDVGIASASGFPLVQIERCQSGVVRTNCMDCLDRTNVVQGMLGRFMLFRQLSDAKLLPLALNTAFQANPLSLPWQEGEVAHRHLWADNADAISRLYAGTPALKGDFTRTGRRTKRGALDDGMNSLQRYYLNNFQDADRQEGVDLLVGFQQFTTVSNDTDTDNVRDETEGPSAFHEMSLREAAHRAILGRELDHDAGEGNHVRIKQSHRRRRSGKFGLLSSRSPPLDLRWLPGDLQTQMRGAISPDVLYTPPPFILESLEARSKLELPWWVTSGSFSDEEDTWAQDQAVVDAEVAASNNPGYLVGAVVAGSQSPFIMATVVLAILVSALPTASPKVVELRSSTDDSSS